MADELLTLPADSMIGEAMADYHVLRNMTRACR